MKLTTTTISILTADLELRAKIAETLNVVPQTIYKYMLKNEENGPLTTVAVVKQLEQETGLNQDQILTEETIAA